MTNKIQGVTQERKKYSAQFKEQTLERVKIDGVKKTAKDLGIDPAMIYSCSMSKKGDCFDNAAMESWNGSLKVEAIHGEYFGTHADAKKHVFEYIEVYYNRERLHSRLGYLSPIFFETQKVA